MSTNHYAMDLPEPTLWWTQHHQQQPFLIEPTQTQTPPIHPSWPPQPPPFPNYPSTTPPLNLNNRNDDVYDENDNDDEDDNNNINDTTTTTKTEAEEEKEPMFEKPLTPSDVGKLNRLVIPKQHAEKYFPLGDSGECKGLLLSFEDESGKCWRFRYSYWNSSQSYVLTKGWSRYVKDKRLDAGDVVLFERHRVDAQRLFISWRRRRQSENALPAHVSRAVKSGGGNNNGGSSKNEVGGGGVGEGWTRGFYSAHPYPTHHHPLPYQHDCLHAGRGSQGENQRTRPVGNSSSSSSSSSSKVLRLFGVNMECQPEHDSGPSTPQSFYNSNIMPTTQGTDHNHHFYHPSSNPHPHPHMVRHQPHYY